MAVLKMRLLYLAGSRRALPNVRLTVPARQPSLYCHGQRYVVRSPCRELAVPSMSLTDYIWRHVSEWSDNICIECAVSGQRYTYADVRDAARRFAISLQRLGMKRQDMLAIVLPNVPEYPIVLLGAVEAGLVVTTVNPVYTVGEMRRQLEDCKAQCVVTDTQRYPTVNAAINENRTSQKPVVIAGSTDLPSGTINLRQLIDSGIDVSSLQEPVTHSVEEMTLLPFSSGTSGLSKGVMLSHKNLVANIEQLNGSTHTLSMCTTKDHQDVIPAILPFFHIYGLVVTLLSKLAIGSKVVSIPKFEPKLFLNIISQHKASLLYLAPPLVLFLASEPQVQTPMLESIRHIMSGAAPLGSADIERLYQKAPSGMRVVQGYGLTETSPVVTQSGPLSTNTASVGLPLPNTCVKVIDMKTGECLGPRQAGELCVSGPQVMLGYFNDPEATAAAIDADGWLHTGDVGHYDENAEFYILDRVKELIKVKGFQVPPAELEELLRSHPLVADAAVIGIPNERAGQVPRAIIVPKKDVKLTENDILNFVADKVAPYKRLEGGVMFVSSIPKNASGKILRRHLRQLLPSHNT